MLIESTKINTPSRPWYREPLMWLVLGLPASAVVAGLVTLWLIVKNADPVLHPAKEIAHERSSGKPLSR